MTQLDIRGSVLGSTALAYKAPCLVATTANVVLNGSQVIDGVLVGNNSERVLVRAQSDLTQNGIYNAETSDWTYAQDWDNNNNVALGTQVLVVSGNTNARVNFMQASADNPIVIGTSLISFVVL
jgi:phage-related tail fiber protein